MKKKLITLILFCIFIVGCQSTNYTCPENYILEGKQCFITYEDKPQIKKTCDYGYELKNNECIMEIIYDATISYSCDKDYTLTYGKYGAGTCGRYVTKNTKEYAVCKDGYTLTSDGFCVTNEKPGLYGICRRGINVGDYCVYWEIPTYSYEKCPDGKDSFYGVCPVFEEKKAKASYTCAKEDKLKGTTCISQIITDAIDIEFCNENFEMNYIDNICIKKVVQAANKLK